MFPVREMWHLLNDCIWQKLTTEKFIKREFQNLNFGKDVSNSGPHGKITAC